MLLSLLAAAVSMWSWWIEPCAHSEQTSCLAADAELAGWALDAWSRAANGTIRFERVTDEKRARLRFYWSGARAGLYGEARAIEVNGQRGAEIYLRPSISRTGDAILRDIVLYMTCLHESGHALGLAHTSNFDDIMYNFQYGGDLEEYFQRWRRKVDSRTGIAKLGGYSEADAQRLRQVIAIRTD